jgi:uncharacterized protein YqeY
MAIKAQLQSDLKEALRARDERRKAVIRLSLAAIVNAEVDKRGELSDGEVAAVLQKEARLRRETIDELKTADRPELLSKEEAELEILEEYLPRPLSRDEIREEARATIDEIGATSRAQMGQVMRRLISQLAGRADGRVINEVVRDLLS